MGANGGWPRLHNLLGDCLGGSLKPVAAEITQDDSGVVRDHTALLAHRLHSVLYVSEAIGETTGGDIPAHTVFCPKGVGFFPFCRQATR